MKCLVSGRSGAHPSAPRLSLKHHQSIKKYPITYNILNRDNIRRRATGSSQVRANNEGEQSINSELIVYPNCVAKSFCHFIYKLVSRFKATQPGFNSRDPQSYCCEVVIYQRSQCNGVRLARAGRARAAPGGARRQPPRRHVQTRRGTWRLSNQYHFQIQNRALFKLKFDLYYN